MKYLSSTPASRAVPCPLCGKTDHCWSADYGQRGILYFCAKNGNSVVQGRDGRTYLLKNNRAFPNGRSNGYFVYEEEQQQIRQREEYIAEQRRLNPNYRANYSSGWRKRTVEPIESMPEKKVVEIDHVSPLPNKALHEIYSYLLSLLVLEDSHRNALLSEWNGSPVDEHLGDKLLSQWLIRSLPMNDTARRASGAKLKNPTRNEIIRKMVSKFGSLRGVPGFYVASYIRDINGKKERVSHWQMSSLSGIVYPCYDSQGYIYRLRVGDEHPLIEEYAKDANGHYIYEKREVVTRDDSLNVVKSKKIGFQIRWDYKTGEWFRENLSSGEKTTIYSPQKGIVCQMTDKGYPRIDGKINGKYKNFSSYKEIREEQEHEILSYNSYQDGCQSGSQISLYCKPGDNWSFVYITEGEKKAAVINAILHCPVICLPGVHTFSKLFEEEYQKGYSMIDFLVKQGLKAVIVVYDADKGINESVLGAEQGLIGLCRDRNLLTFVGEWDPRFGKGADDILLQGKSFDFYEVK